MREFCGTTPLLDEPDSTATLKLVDYTHVAVLACRARRAPVNPAVIRCARAGIDVP
jgi:hypothetical protein